MRRFGDQGIEILYERLASLRQNGSREICATVWFIAFPKQPKFRGSNIGIFYGRAAENIRQLERPHDPRDLSRAMEIACEVEEAIKQMCSMREQKNVKSIQVFNFKEEELLCPEQG